MVEIEYKSAHLCKEKKESYSIPYYW